MSGFFYTTHRKYEIHVTSLHCCIGTSDNNNHRNLRKKNDKSRISMNKLWKKPNLWTCNCVCVHVGKIL